jgi:hypothetical protein
MSTTDSEHGQIEEPIGTVTIPVYCDWRPGQTSGSMRFRIVDCIVEVSEGEGDSKVHLGRVAGCIGGAYEVEIGEHTYSMNPQDIWESFQAVHAKFAASTQEPKS